MTVSFIGLTNGAVYALVALGYTLVYGILELINFAHGDVFMLGGMISATMLISTRLRPGGERVDRARSIPALLVLARGRDGRLRPASTRRSSSSRTGRYAARRDSRR